MTHDYGNFSGPIAKLLDHEILTSTQEKRLARRMSSENPMIRRRAKETLARHNMKLVAKISKKYTPKPPLTYDEIFAAGCKGLNRAIDGFDLEKGHRFSTYATYWIRQTISRSFEDDGRLIRVPAHLHQQLAKLSRQETRLSIEGGTDPSEKELAVAMDVDPAHIRFLRSVRETTSKNPSLDAPASPAGSSVSQEPSPILLDALPATETSAEDLLPYLFDDTTIEAAELLSKLDTLPEQSAYIIRERYGIGGGEPKTLRELSQILGISAERIRQKQIQASRTLYRSLVPVRSRNRDSRSRSAPPLLHDTRQLSLL